MKTTKILLTIIALLVCHGAKSQLSVNSQGNVALNGILSIGATHDSTKCVNIEKIMPDRTAPLYGVYAHTLYPRTSSSVGPMFGVVGFADASNPNEASMPMPIVGVYGRASKCSEHQNSFSAGVVGMCNYYNGVAVYGGIGDNNATVPYTSLGTYAGYFNGAVKVTGTLYSSTYQTTSDMRLKRDISEIKSDALSKLSRLNPIQYFWDKEQYIKLKMNNIDTSDKEKHTLVDVLLDNNIHYGLLAQEVKELYPELVHEDAAGVMSINYTELIPLLIQAVQNLSEQVSSLSNSSSASARKQAPKQSDSTIEAVVATLYQNNPNPFTEATVISYIVPVEAQQAAIYIYNMVGEQLSKYDISVFGEGNVTISANELYAGTFLYSLVVDGKLIDTKQMIITQ